MKEWVIGILAWAIITVLAGISITMISYRGCAQFSEQIIQE